MCCLTNWGGETSEPVGTFRAQLCAGGWKQAVGICGEKGEGARRHVTDVHEVQPTNYVEQDTPHILFWRFRVASP